MGDCLKTRRIDIKTCEMNDKKKLYHLSHVVVTSTVTDAYNNKVLIRAVFTPTPYFRARLVATDLKTLSTSLNT